MQVKSKIPLHQPHIRAKILGLILIFAGIIFFTNPTSLNIKVGFASVIIGSFMFIIITEKKITKATSDAIIEGNISLVKNIIKRLNLNGNAIFLPKSINLAEERILIPPNRTGTIKIPNMKHDNVFLTSKDGKKLGISLPPSGLKLLRQIEIYESFNTADLENINDKLQKFVGMDLVKSVSFSKNQTGWVLEIEKPMNCPKDPELCRQYPCPACSAIITAIAKTASKDFDQKLLITDVKQNGIKTTFKINFIKKRKTKRD